MFLTITLISSDSTTDNTACTILDETPSTSNACTPKSFSDYLQTLDPTTPTQSSSNIDNFESDLSTYERKSRLPLNANVLEYWDSSNIISGIANILLAIPSTQVSVERLFSAMKYMLSDQRNRLSPLNLEHILMVKANGIFNYQLGSD